MTTTITLPEPIRLLAAILDHVGPIPDEWRDQARAIVREASEDPDAFVTLADVRRACEQLRAQGIGSPWYCMHASNYRIEEERPDEAPAVENVSDALVLTT